MQNSKIEAEIHFRFQRLDKMQAFTLTREIIGSCYEEELAMKRYTGYVPLTVENFDDINDYFVRQRIEIGACDIFISVTALTTDNTVELPAIVNKMLKYIDCKLTFSVKASGSL